MYLQHAQGWIHLAKGKHTKHPKNYSHKYNLFAINFLGNLWTKHLGLFLIVLSIFD
jgi:hypothetical protein